MKIDDLQAENMRYKEAYDDLRKKYAEVKTHNLQLRHTITELMTISVKKENDAY